MILEDLSQADHAERVKSNVEQALAKPMPLGTGEQAAAIGVRMHSYPEAPPNNAAYNEWRFWMRQGSIPPGTSPAASRPRSRRSNPVLARYSSAPIIFR